MRVEHEFEDVLHDIESVVTDIYAKHPELVDHQVDKIYNILARTYEAEIKGKNPPQHT